MTTIVLLLALHAPSPSPKARPVQPFHWPGQYQWGVWRVTLGEGGGYVATDGESLYLGTWREIGAGQIEVSEWQAPHGTQRMQYQLQLHPERRLTSANSWIQPH